MGVVYRARDPVLQRDIALKVLAPHLAADPQARDEFLSEARAAAQLAHPNIVTVHEAGVEDGHVFIAMELVEGGDLRDELDRSGRLSPERAHAILRDIGDALDHAHSRPQPVIHRDIKPANILMTRDGRPKVADFGISKIYGDVSRTATGMLKGTLAYMAPELFEGAMASPKTDQWSLGVLAYELLAGSHPFMEPGDTKDHHLSIMMRIAKANPPGLMLASDNAKVEPEIDRAVRRALSRTPESRYDSASALAGALTRILSPGIIHRVPRWAYASMAVLAVALIALAVYNPYRIPAEFKEQADKAFHALERLRGAGSDGIAAADFLTVHAENLRSVEDAGAAIAKMDLPKPGREVGGMYIGRASGYYYVGSAHFYRALHFAERHNQQAFSRSVESLEEAWLKAGELGLPPAHHNTVKANLKTLSDFDEAITQVRLPEQSWRRLSAAYLQP
jgi:serine/threonine-protein kinase